MFRERLFFVVSGAAVALGALLAIPRRMHATTIGRPLLLCALAATGCVSAEEVGKSDYALSQPGAWDIDDSVVAIGDTQYVEYTSAGPWVGTSGCGGGLLTGTAQLRDYLGANFPQISHIGGYSCRSINGDGAQMSVHATGRALDIHIPTHVGEADNDLGDPLGHWLIEHAEEIGIQYIIWDLWTWNASRPRGSKERAYGGAHPHHDHLHIELSVEGGDAATAFFDGPMSPPEIAECPPLTSAGGTIEETSGCFVAYGPATYWRSESAGHGGSMLWTNAWESASPGNWARWHVDLEEGGEYELEIYAEPTFSVHSATRYEIRHGDVEHAVEVDLSAALGWISLGAFDFAPGGGQHVSVYDNTSTPIDPDQHIPADAIRLTRVEPTAPTPMPDPSVIYSAELEVAEVVAVPDGNPMVDDDPLPPREALSGCSAAAAASSSAGRGWVLLIFTGLLFAKRRAS